MRKLSEHWKDDEIARWLENGIWLTVGLGAGMPKMLFLAMTLSLLRWWRLWYIQKKWRKLLAEAEAKGLFGTAK
jgi:hypothetical protein